jgi:hypothetical protein
MTHEDADFASTGIVHINDQTMDEPPGAPYGGIGASSTSARFGGHRQPGRLHRHPLGHHAQRHRPYPLELAWAAGYSRAELAEWWLSGGSGRA